MRRGRSRAVHAALIAVSLVVVLTWSAAATAETQAPQDFEGFTLGSPDGQSGWQFTGAYDAAIADPGDFGVSGMGERAFRISNASTSGSFGDWVFSQSLVNDAGEAGADGGVYTGGVREGHFEASFDLTSAEPGAEQPGLQFSLAPDRGDGARMSFLRFNDTPDGIDVTFADYVDRHPQGPASGCGAEDEFVSTTIASGLDRSAIHDVRITMDFLPGSANDRVEVFIDGALAHAGTSWEDYFRYCEGNPTRPVDSLIFQARTGAGTAPGTLGKGFLIDDLQLTSEQIEDPTTDGTWTLYPEQEVTTSTTTSTAYQTKVRPPINADGSSNWPKKRGVIPVQFDLESATKTTTTTTTGPVVFESILSDGDDANDFSFLRFVPNGELVFSDLTELVSDYTFLEGGCYGGSLRWSVGLDTTGDGVRDGSIFIYYGEAPQFGNGGVGDCTGAGSQSGDNLIGMSDPRYDTSQLGGTFYDTYAGALSSLGDARVTSASLVLDSGWVSDQRVDLDGATANNNDWEPLPEGSSSTTVTGPFSKTCNLPQAEIKWTKTDPIPDGAVNETAESIQSKDTGVHYRQVDCKYIYNLDLSSLGPESTRQGTYFVYAKVGGQLLQAPAKFDLR